MSASTSNTAFPIAKELDISVSQVEAVSFLLDEGCTIPFIARYRKEATGSLDEVMIVRIRDKKNELMEMEKRRTSILKSLSERELLTEELKTAILGAPNLIVLEDIYLQYRPKRRTRASIATEKGLAPLAEKILKQEGGVPFSYSQDYVDPEKGINSVDEVLQGAMDILAEKISEDRATRSCIRRIFVREGIVVSSVAKGMEEKGIKYQNYFEWKEKALAAPSHRILALFRGEKERYLTLRIRPEDDRCLREIKKHFVRSQNEESKIVEKAVEDGYKRLLAPSMETELRNALKKKADEQAITVFAQNIREVLMAPPLGHKNILAIDPGFRTGCKVVCLDRQGKLVHTETIFPHPPQKREEESAQKVLDMMKRFSIEAIAIGNGTAGRETESFIQNISFPKKPIIAMVNESGASVYSASEIARLEFPDYDVTVRGAISIGRRLMDPLSELIKIDPRSLGVGQYQHDVDPKALKQALDDVVASCVNAVGVDVNTASKELLTFVSGVGSQLAENIVRYREENGLYQTREDLKKVPRLGPKAFEQSAGFLRIPEGNNPLDASAVHPENYGLVEKIAQDLETTIHALITDNKLRKNICLDRYVTGEIGLPTLQDIMAELEKPGRDPRQKFDSFVFAEDITDISHLRKGMILPGIITNVTAFGAFVDIGIHQDGLIHISALSDHFIKFPQQVVSPGQRVEVMVIALDIERKRISLSMKKSDLIRQVEPHPWNEQGKKP
ncbi:Tex family protein [Aminobacterium mobile]|uniref:Tex family protein n=2 Tax=Aminobacterium mobile TaxID=81467 RepID=UPI000463304E|nr:Tex family protein [Aminobacterium mobile]